MNLLKENANIFLPVLGLVAVIIAMAFVDLGPEGDLIGVLNGVERDVYKEEPGMDLKEGYDYGAEVKTNYGNFEINLFEDIAPRNVNNFIFLAEEGFYDGLQFYRIIPEFTIQAGYVDEEEVIHYTVEDEIRGFVRFEDYTVAMTNEGEPNTNRSDFFVTLADSDVGHLDGDYTIIGEVSDGSSVVERIGNVDVGDDFVPEEEIVIEEIVIKKEE